MWLNGVGGGLVQLGIWKGLSPRLLDRKWNASSVRLRIRLSAVLVILLSLCVSNTPERFKWVSGRIGFLQPFANNPQIMNEFGYRHADPDFGEFYSRLSLQELRENDEMRAEEAAKVLNEYSGEDRYQDFLRQYPPVKDPFIHEMRVHLFRRDRYMKYALEAGDEKSSQAYLIVAWAEHLIVGKYFTRTLSLSSYRLSPAARDMLERYIPEEPDPITVVPSINIWLRVFPNGNFG